MTGPITLADLKPASYNPRRITDKQKEQMDRSYRRFGDLSGIIFNRTTGNLIGGHQRTDLFTRNKSESRIVAEKNRDDFGTVREGRVEIIIKDGRGKRRIRIPYREVKWDALTEKAANIAANAGGGEWDTKKLGAVLADLRKGKFAVEDIPIDEMLSKEALAEFKANAGGGNDTPAEEAKRELSEKEKELQRRAWRRLVSEWDAIVADTSKRGYVSASLTKGATAVEFVNALLHGTKMRRISALSYCPHRLFVPGDKFAINEVFSRARKNDAILDSMIWAAQGKSTFEGLLFGHLPIHGHRLPADFPVELAQGLIDEFCPKNGKVLDPCHGWGGRMLGFLLSRKPSSYTGFDVDPNTHKGVQALYDDLHKLAMMPKEANLQLCPYEDSKLRSDTYDFALTSPPYFDTESYQGKNQSRVRYKDGYEAWVKGFYAPLIHKTARALKPKAVFCLQVGSQRYPLAKDAMRIAPEAGFKYIETRTTDMTNNQAKTEAMDGEVVIVLRKKG